MSLKFEVSSEELDSLDEGYKGLYKEHGEGVYRLTVEGLDPADELKGALHKEREERKKAKERAEELELQIKAKEQESLEAQRKAAEEAGEHKQLYEIERKQRQQIAEESDKKLSELKAELDALKEKQETDAISSVSSKIGLSLAPSDESSAELLAEKAAAMAKFTEDGVIYEIDGVLADENKVKEHLRAKYSRLCDAKIGSGGGAGGSSNSGGATKKTTAEILYG